MYLLYCVKLNIWKCAHSNVWHTKSCDLWLKKKNNEVRLTFVEGASLTALQAEILYLESKNSMAVTAAAETFPTNCFLCRDEM